MHSTFEMMKNVLLFVCGIGILIEGVILPDFTHSSTDTIGSGSLWVPGRQSAGDGGMAASM